MEQIVVRVIINIKPNFPYNDKQYNYCMRLAAVFLTECGLFSLTFHCLCFCTSTTADKA